MTLPEATPEQSLRNFTVKTGHHTLKIYTNAAKARIVAITTQCWIPEFPSILPLLIILTILAAILTKKKTSKTSN